MNKRDKSVAREVFKAVSSIEPEAYAVFRSGTEVIKRKKIGKTLSPEHMAWPKGAACCTVEIELKTDRYQITKQIGLTYVVGVEMNPDNIGWIHISLKPECCEPQYVLCADGQLRAYATHMIQLISPASVTFE